MLGDDTVAYHEADVAADQLASLKGIWVLNKNFGNDGYTRAETGVTEEAPLRNAKTFVIPNATYMENVGVWLHTDDTTWAAEADETGMVPLATMAGDLRLPQPAHSLHQPLRARFRGH